MFLTGPTAGFVSRLTPDGSGLIASTYLAGNYTDFASTVRVDADSNVTVAGGTWSSDFVSTAPSACGPRADGGLFVTKLDGLLQRVVSSAILPQQSARGASAPSSSRRRGARASACCRSRPATRAIWHIRSTRTGTPSGPFAA